MHDDPEEVIAENVLLRLWIAGSRQETLAGSGVTSLDDFLQRNLAYMRRIVADGGLPAASTIRPTLAQTPNFLVTAYKAYLINAAWPNSGSDAAVSAIIHLVADTILARVFARTIPWPTMESGPERISQFTAFLRKKKLDVVARLYAWRSGDGPEDPLAIYHSDIEARITIYASALFGTFYHSAPSAALRKHWSHLIVTGGLEARHIHRLNFGGPPRLLKAPVVFTEIMPEQAEITLRIQSLQAPGTGPARAFVALGARDGNGQFLPVTFSLQDTTRHFAEEGPLLCGEILAQPTWTGRIRLITSTPATEITCCVVPLSPGEGLTVWSQFRDEDGSWIDLVPEELRAWVAEHVRLAQHATQLSTQEQAQDPGDHHQLNWPKPLGSHVAAIAAEEDVNRRSALISKAAGFILQNDLDSAVQHLVAHVTEPDTISRLFHELADLVADARPDIALRLYWLSYGICPSVKRGQRLSSKMFLAGNISSALALSRDKSQTTTHLQGELRLAAALRHTGQIALPRAPQSPAGSSVRIAYVASAAQPFQITGYTVRTHQLLSALKKAGTHATCFLRPGYPHDRARLIQAWPEGSGDAQEFAYRIEGVPYQTSWVPGVDHDPEHFIQRMAARLVAQFDAYQPTIVQAASNYRNALPALMAARRLGIPFVYEVRGLWELTAASRKAGWEATERFRFDQAMERYVASEADIVLTITRALAVELARGGVPEDKIRVLPNAVDPDYFTPAQRDEALARALGVTDSFTLVYAGSLTAYEGLDDLIEAIGILRMDSVPVSLIIIGDGVVRPTLEMQVRDKNLQAVVQFLGQIRPNEISRYISLAHAVALPRKAYQVCKIVSPLKPFEAMAMAKPVILTDLPVLREIVQDGRTGLICQPENPHDLARALRNLVEDPVLCRDLGEAARHWVVEERSWAANAALLKDLYAQLAAQAPG